ncbi:MAG TPA: nascent polypeptide-associated complex protein [Candidatus Thermoplasmatota archaeon]|nr:nascent polypeptide-associated complex protein [Candidatus Thermoplasmatota archaeon]
MMPGLGGRIDPRRMNQMMRQLGIDVKDVENVQEVIIRTPTQEIVFEKPEVTIMTAQGQKTYQVVGNPRTAARGAPAPLVIPEEDVKLVAEQSGKSHAEAKKALESTKGDIAEAILKLSS